MNLDPNNKVVKLCIEGIHEEADDINAAKQLYSKAWNNAQTSYEKLIAAHYLARNQPIEAELKWNITALENALQVTDTDIKGALPSLYLNIGKSYETSGDIKEAASAYRLAKKHSEYLNDDEYGKMILAGINKAILSVDNKA